MGEITIEPTLRTTSAILAGVLMVGYIWLKQDTAAWIALGILATGWKLKINIPQFVVDHNYKTR